MSENDQNASPGTRVPGWVVLAMSIPVILYGLLANEVHFFGDHASPVTLILGIVMALLGVGLIGHPWIKKP